MSNTKLRIGIIGCGGIANQKHFPGLKANADLCEMVAFCDIIPERAEKAAKEHGIKGAKVFTDYKELLNEKDIDVVHVLTPNVSHCPITVDAFAAGKHVMCEKPMAATTADAQKMLDAWKKSGRLFTIGYQNRFRPEIQTLKKACVSGDLGEIYFAKAHAIRRCAVPTWGVFPNKALQGGGPLIDIGTHALDLTLWMMNNYEPANVSGSVFFKLGNLPEAAEHNMFGPWDTKTFEVEDSAFGFIKMKDGATIVLEASWAINLRESNEAATTLCGTKAGADIRSNFTGGGELMFNRGKYGKFVDEKVMGNSSIAFFEGASATPAAMEAKQWLKAIIDGGQPLVKPQEAFTVTKILDAIYESARNNKEVVF
jgi:Predicted dehydrogenases and related proteins